MAADQQDEDGLKEGRRSRPPRGEDDEAKGIAWIVEDSALDAEIAKRALSARYEVEVFVDGSSMLERLATTPRPDLLILDWQLPGMSGLEVCRFLRSTLDDMELPVLMVTVYGHKSDVVEGLSAGANDYVSKPYDGAELLARATTLRRTRRLYQQREHLLEETRQARARAEEASRAKDEFLATVSHELRTPLNAISGWVQLLLGGMLPPEKVNRAHETIARNARAQTQLINDLLDASRIITGKLRLELEPVHLVDVLEMAIEALRPTADAREIQVLPTLDPGAGPILGDASRLQQVVWNLLANAVKFTPRGGRVRIGLRRDQAFVELSVEDTGQGIEPAFLPHVFERFRQADSSSDRRHGGLGIGLAIARHITELHGGTIAVASEGDGRGAKFTVRLPLPPQRVEAVSRVEKTAQPLERGSSQRLAELEGLRILVVDDEPDAREILAFVLESCNAKVIAASSAAEALEVLRTTVPDMLVSDLGMPGEDGLVLIQKVRALPPDQGGRTPAVALTAYARAEDRTKALNAGFDVHVAKPVHPTELIAVIVELASRITGR